MQPGEQHLTDSQFERLRRLIRAEAGINLAPAKRLMLETRLRRRMRASGTACFDDYCGEVHGAANSAELVHLLDAVSTNKTDFFREPPHFAFLQDRLLPEWMASGAKQTLRIWSAGCSSGQEPYTLAMLLSDCRNRHPGLDFEILGTDLNTDVLEEARTAIYPAAEAEKIPRELSAKYLLVSKDRTRELVRVAPEIRRLVEFRRLNFMDRDYGFHDFFNAIFFRNVMIYFDRPTQSRVLKRLVGCLVPGGYLFSGHAESLHGFDLPLAPVAPTVYQRTG